MVAKGIIMCSKAGYATLYSENEVSVLGVKAGGIKGINLKMMNWPLCICLIQPRLNQFAFLRIPQESREFIQAISLHAIEQRKDL